MIRFLWTFTHQSETLFLERILSLYSMKEKTKIIIITFEEKENGDTSMEWRGTKDKVKLMNLFANAANTMADKIEEEHNQDTILDKVKRLLNP